MLNNDSYGFWSVERSENVVQVIAVFIFMRAWKEHENFERSSDLTRLGWFFNTMGSLDHQRKVCVIGFFMGYLMI